MSNETQNPDGNQDYYYDYEPVDHDADSVPQDPNYDPDVEYQDSDLPQQEIDRADAARSVLSGGGIKGAATDWATQKAKDAVPEGAQEVVDKTQKAATLAGKLKTDVMATFTAIKSGFVFLANPYIWIVLAVVVIIGAIIVGVVAGTQVHGTTQTSTQGGSAAGAMQQRLAQRADWLQKHYSEYGGESGPLYDLAPGAPGSGKSNLSSNAWRAACPNIVAFIYGLSPYLINYNGVNNAESNWENHPEMYESYAFNSGRTSGAGVSLSRPPAGAIVSIDYGTVAGHTFVMLTDELVIDNWSGGGIVFGNVGGGPRVISETMRGQITGWALPKSEGFEGTFITGSFEGAAEGAPDQEPMPDLGPVPTWAGGDGSATGPAYTGGTGDKTDWMTQAGIAESDWTYVDYIVSHESSWNPKATNASSGACGLVQALPCSKVPGDGYNPVDNLKWGDGYAKSRYGSWKEAYDFWKANSWW